MKLKLTGLLMFLLAVLPAQAQEKVDMADTWRTDGKIWVVIAVMGIILGGLLAYVAISDRKISKLEKEIRKDQQQ